jgi:hypothetical protein
VSALKDTLAEIDKFNAELSTKHVYRIAPPEQGREEEEPNPITSKDGRGVVQRELCQGLVQRGQ